MTGSKGSKTRKEREGETQSERKTFLLRKEYQTPIRRHDNGKCENSSFVCVINESEIPVPK